MQVALLCLAECPIPSIVANRSPAEVHWHFLDLNAPCLHKPTSGMQHLNGNMRRDHFYGYLVLADWYVHRSLHSCVCSVVAGIGEPLWLPTLTGAAIGLVTAVAHRYCNARLWRPPTSPLNVLITGGTKGLGKVGRSWCSSWQLLAGQPWPAAGTVFVQHVQLLGACIHTSAEAPCSEANCIGVSFMTLSSGKHAVTLQLMKLSHSFLIAGFSP